MGLLRLGVAWRVLCIQLEWFEVVVWFWVFLEWFFEWLVIKLSISCLIVSLLVTDRKGLRRG